MITTIALIATQFSFGIVMFSGEAWSDWINSGLHVHLLLELVVILVLAVLSLIYGARKKKKKRGERQATLDHYVLEDGGADSDHAASEVPANEDFSAQTPHGIPFAFQ